MSTLFSIVIPCYNQAHFLPDCLESLIRQSYQNWEALLINDGSSDNTRQVAESYVAKDSRIKLFEKKNGGLSSARNYALPHVTGNLIQFLDSDDWILPNCLETIATNVEDRIDLIVSGYGYCKEQSKKIIHTHKPNDPKIALIDLIVKQNLGPCHSIFIKSDIIRKVGVFDQELKSCEDWDFWIRAIKVGANIKFIPDILVIYRYVENSMSRNPKVMYESLLLVNERATKKDDRLVGNYPLNIDYQTNLSTLFKFHLINCLGVSLMQGNVESLIKWFLEEKKKWNWDIELSDFCKMNSYLSFKYFSERQEINFVLKEIKPNFITFFSGLGYTKKEIIIANKYVFESQLKKNNHFKYGKFIGAFLNKLKFYE